ncbi:hypothetical protein D3C76_1470760 [compost metagenome]
MLSIEQRLTGVFACIKKPGAGTGGIQLGRTLAFAPALEVGDSGMLEPVRQTVD